MSCSDMNGNGGVYRKPGNPLVVAVHLDKDPKRETRFLPEFSLNLVFS